MKKVLIFAAIAGLFCVSCKKEEPIKPIPAGTVLHPPVSKKPTR